MWCIDEDNRVVEVADARRSSFEDIELAQHIAKELAKFSEAPDQLEYVATTKDTELLTYLFRDVTGEDDILVDFYSAMVKNPKTPLEVLNGINYWLSNIRPTLESKLLALELQPLLFGSSEEPDELVESYTQVVKDPNVTYDELLKVNEWASKQHSYGGKRLEDLSSSVFLKKFMAEDDVKQMVAIINKHDDLAPLWNSKDFFKNKLLFADITDEEAEYVIDHTDATVYPHLVTNASVSLDYRLKAIRKALDETKIAPAFESAFFSICSSNAFTREQFDKYLGMVFAFDDTDNDVLLYKLPFNQLLSEDQLKAVVTNLHVDYIRGAAEGQLRKRFGSSVLFDDELVRIACKPYVDYPTLELLSNPIYGNRVRAVAVHMLVQNWMDDEDFFEDIQGILSEFKRDASAVKFYEDKYGSLE